jgi:hypothetical protein
MQLSKYKRLYEHNFSKEPGGHVEFIVATRKMVPPLIQLAEAVGLMLGEGQNYHHDSIPYQQLKQKVHDALREVESA